MQLLDLTLESAASNIALDEALLERAESDGSVELLRLWEPTQPIVVVGRSSPIALEVNLDECHRQRINVFRRCSGGASIVAGPNCLMYALILGYENHPELKMLEKAHLFVMERMAASIRSLGMEIEMQGTCDLTIFDKKFSGNALRCKRNWLMYHGTMLCKSFDVDLISRCLGRPRRQPAYRRNRTHSEFITVLPVPIKELRTAIIKRWNAHESTCDWPESLTRRLTSQKYLSPAWTNKV